VLQIGSHRDALGRMEEMRCKCKNFGVVTIVVMRECGDYESVFVFIEDAEGAMLDIHTIKSGALSLNLIVIKDYLLLNYPLPTY
jgi:methylaspartate ammonia-lyase